MPREKEEACSDRSPHEAKRNAGSAAKSAPDFAALHPGYKLRENDEVCADVRVPAERSESRDPGLDQSRRS